MSLSEKNVGLLIFLQNTFLIDFHMGERFPGWQYKKCPFSVRYCVHSYVTVTYITLPPVKIFLLVNDIL
jgi:hypothetical protein